MSHWIRSLLFLLWCAAGVGSGCVGSGGLVERNVAYPGPDAKANKALVVMSIEVSSNRMPLQIPNDAQIALTYQDSKGTIIKTKGVENDGPSMALLIKPGSYTIIGLDAIATLCPDGQVRTMYNQSVREPISFEVVANSVSYLGKLHVQTRCFERFTGRTLYKQQGNRMIEEPEYIWTVELLGATRRSDASDMPRLKQDYPNVAWDQVEVRDLSGG